MTISVTQHRARAPIKAVTRSGNVAVEREVLFAGHAECPGCGSFIRQLTDLGTPSAIGDLVEGWCSVCCTSTYFLMTA